MEVIFKLYIAIIKKKTWPKEFNLIKRGKKKFELRLADFKIKANDTLVLEEYNPKTKSYSGRKIRRKAKFVYKFDLDQFGQKQEIEKNGFYIIQI
ncbi:MAG: DUF3850 domain-containing protein [Patescibacteria group bacterium]